MIRGSSLSLSSFSKLYGSSIFHSIILWRFLRCRLSTRFLWKTKSVGKFSTKHEKQVQIGKQKTITNTHLFWSKTLHFLLLFWYNKSTIKCLVLCHPFLQALYHFEPAEFRRLPHKYLPVQVIANTQIPTCFLPVIPCKPYCIGYIGTAPVLISYLCMVPKRKIYVHLKCIMNS